MTHHQKVSAALKVLRLSLQPMVISIEWCEGEDHSGDRGVFVTVGVHPAISGNYGILESITAAVREIVSGLFDCPCCDGPFCYVNYREEVVEDEAMAEETVRAQR